MKVQPALWARSPTKPTLYMVLADAEDAAGNARPAFSESSVCLGRGLVAARDEAATQRWRERAAGAAGAWCWRVKAPLPVYPWYS